MINLLFCKLLDEQKTNPDDPVTFQAGVGESHQETQGRTFEQVKKKAAYSDV